MILKKPRSVIESTFSYWLLPSSGLITNDTLSVFVL